MSKLRRQSKGELMSDACLLLCFAGLFAAFVFIVFVMGW